mgnify:CR=1 FL=1
MIAVILIGGLGTRLRPLTVRTPKPLLPVLNRPFIEYQLSMLRSQGIKDVLLCSSYRAEDFRRALGNGRSLGLRLRYVEEKVPLGTGGAVKNAESLIKRSGTALVLNGDVLNTFDLRAFQRFHRARKALATIALTEVMDPTHYGLVRTDKSGRIVQFIEKPSADEVVVPTINAGAYLFEPAALALIPPDQPYSLERGLFPELLSARGFFGYRTESYWIDIGTVQNYLRVHLDMLGGRTNLEPRALKRSLDGGKVLIGAKTSIAAGVRFSGHVSIGGGCRIGPGAMLKDCVVLDGSVIGENARIEGSVIGSRCRIGRQSAVVGAGAVAGGSRLEPYTRIG